jgi:hypothetical protein
MQEIANALEAYMIDWNAAPPWDSWTGTTTGDRVSYFWRALTTPVSYIDAPLRDPFGPPGDETYVEDGQYDNNDPFFQVATGRRRAGHLEDPALFYCIASYGPDYQDDTKSLGSYPHTRHACPYDPTNGIVSRGDIYLFGGKPATNFLSDLDYDRRLPGAPKQFEPWW